MTEIQFLISLMLEHKLPEPVKQKLIARIGEVEALLSRPGHMSAVTPRTIIQAPSTQAILDQDTVHTPPPPPATKRIVGGEVSTGNGTKGPRKW